MIYRESSQLREELHAAEAALATRRRSALRVAGARALGTLSLMALMALFGQRTGDAMKRGEYRCDYRPPIEEPVELTPQTPLEVTPFELPEPEKPHAD